MASTTFATLPFDAAALEAAGLRVADHEYAEISPDQCKLRKLLLGAVSRGPSFALSQVDRDGDSDDEDASFDKVQKRTTAAAGLGLHRLDYGGKTLRVLHQAVGQPVGSNCGAELYKSVVVLAKREDGGLAFIRDVLDELIEKSEASDPRTFSIYRWHLKHHYWRHDSKAPVRPLESVVLPAATKKKIVDDVVDFLADDTKQFYQLHGIPYRRSYLFYGRPGAGKTSLIAGLASRFDRNLCYLTLCHKDMTDDTLKSCVHKTPRRSIIILEDVDALFAKDRSKKNADCALTFSGLLNSLDGIGAATGQIFVLTTNERHNLDEALIRHGRVDLQVEFMDCVPEQAAAMWEQFYPASADLAGRFSEKLFAALAGRQLSTAALQGFFVLRRRKTAADALASVGDITVELDARDAEKAFLANESETKEPSDGKEAPSDGKKADDDAPSKGGATPAPGAGLFSFAQLLELVKALPQSRRH